MYLQRRLRFNYRHQTSRKNNKDKIKMIIKNDDFDKFMNEVEKRKSKERFLKYRASDILSENEGRIFNYMVENYTLRYARIKDYFFNKIDENNKNTKTKLLFDILLNQKFTNDEYGKIIEQTVKFQMWEICDYLHILGYKSNNHEFMIKKYPNNRFRNLEYYGYDLTKSLLLYNIKYSSINVDILTRDLVKRYRSYILKYLRYDKLRELDEKGFIRLNKKDCYNVCENVNISGAIYFVEKGFNINQNLFNYLFGIKKKVKSKKNNKRARYVGRNSRIHRNHIINILASRNNLKNYEDLMINFLDKLYENSKNIYKIRNSIWIFLFQKKYFKLIDKLHEIGYKPNIQTLYVNYSIYKAVLNNNLDLIKIMLRLDLIEANVLSKKSFLLDNAIINRSKDVYNFFIRELKMKCSGTIIRNYTRCGKTSKIKFFDLIKLLESLDFPIKDKMLTYAYENNDIDTIKYMVEEKGILPTSKQIEIVILKRNKELIDYLLQKGIKIRKNKLIDRLLKSEYIDMINLNLIKYVRKKYGATASQKSINYCFMLKSKKILEYLVKEMNLHYSILDIERYIQGQKKRIYISRSIDIGNRIDFELYLIDNMVDLNLTDDIKKLFVSRWIQYGNNVRSENFKHLIDKLNYKFTIQNVQEILEYSNVTAFEILLEQGIEITEQLINEMICYSNLKFLKILVDNYNVDLKKYLNLKQFNTHVASWHLHTDMAKFLIEVIGIQITPYTLELYLGKTYRYGVSQLLMYFIKMLNYKITNKSKELLLRLKNINRHNKNIEDCIKKCEIIEYQPNPDEIVVVGGILIDEDMFIDVYSGDENVEDDDVEEVLDIDLEDNIVYNENIMDEKIHDDNVVNVNINAE